MDPGRATESSHPSSQRERPDYQPALAPNRTNERNAIIASQGCSHPSWLIDPSYMKADGSSGILHNY
ncbi:hypothetical protein OIU76_028297 [Salix suchowensis]|nr:hypothetical protein OIU76_028297 [Salix suchowensis]